jgi:hypothetical protein
LRRALLTCSLSVLEKKRERALRAVPVLVAIAEMLET